MNPIQTYATCPHCGSGHTHQLYVIARKGMMAGGMLGMAAVVGRLISKPIPVMAPALIAGAVIGLLWGSQAGRSVGGMFDGLMPRYRCLGCGKEFDE